MQGSFSVESVESYYNSFEGVTVPKLDGEMFNFAETALSVKETKVPTKKKSKAEKHFEKAQSIFEMAEQRYEKAPTDENLEKVYLAEALLKKSEVVFREDMRLRIEEFRYSENFDLMDFTRCERPNGSVYGTAGSCKKGVETNKVPLNDPKRPLSSGDTPMEKIKTKLKRYESAISDPEVTPSNKQLEQYGMLRNSLTELENLKKNPEAKGYEPSIKAVRIRKSTTPEVREAMRKAKFLIDLEDSFYHDYPKDTESLRKLGKRFRDTAKEAEEVAQVIKEAAFPKWYHPNRKEYMKTKEWKNLSEDNAIVRLMDSLAKSLELSGYRFSKRANQVDYLIQRSLEEG